MKTQIQEQLYQQYPYKIEMHAHSTPASHCSEIAPERVVELYKEKGYDAIVLTNHFNFDLEPNREKAVEIQMADYRRAVRAGNEMGLRVYLGTEVRFTENGNDYLVYGVNEDLLRQIFDYLRTGLAVFRKEVNLEHSVFIQAHPFRPHCVIADAMLLDGIELFNLHPHHNSNAQAALAHASLHPEFIFTAGSDFHHEQPGHCASTALLSRKLPADSFALADLLRSKDYLLRLHDSIFVP